MSLMTLIPFSIAIFILAVTPGPGVFTVVARAVTAGFKQAALVAVGVIIGDILFLLFAIYGLSTLAESLHWLFISVKYCGAAYLMYLGCLLWKSVPEKVAVKELQYRSCTSSLWAGLCITLGNPKVILFYMAFLPTFVDLESVSASDVALIAMLVTTILGTVMISYAYTAARAACLFQSRRSRTFLHRSAGTTIFAAGVSLTVKT